MKLKKISLLSLVLVVSSLGYVASAKTEQELIQQRLQSVGEVHLKGEQEQAASASASADASLSVGERVYKNNCVVCHAAGVAGAPKFRNKTDWKTRAAAGMADMLKKAIKGINAMPARGACADCSDEDIKAAIEHMLPKS